MRLPRGHGVTVSPAELAKGATGAGATTDAEALALLAGRPGLQHLLYSMEANGLLVDKVRCCALHSTQLADSMQLADSGRCARRMCACVRARAREGGGGLGALLLHYAQCVPECLCLPPVHAHTAAPTHFVLHTHAPGR